MNQASSALHIQRAICLPAGKYAGIVPPAEHRCVGNTPNYGLISPVCCLDQPRVLIFPALMFLQQKHIFLRLRLPVLSPTSL